MDMTRSLTHNNVWALSPITPHTTPIPRQIHISAAELLQSKEKKKKLKISNITHRLLFSNNIFRLDRERRTV